jgi:hypothetical protein
MGYDLTIYDKSGNVRDAQGQSYNWNQFINNPLPIKKFRGHTSETVVRICLEWFANNPHYQAYWAKYCVDPVVWKELVMPKVRHTHVIADIIVGYTKDKPIDKVVDGYGHHYDDAEEEFDDEEFVLYREYRHIHDIIRFFNIAMTNPGCYWDVDYYMDDFIWHGIAPMTFQEYLSMDI